MVLEHIDRIGSVEYVLQSERRRFVIHAPTATKATVVVRWPHGQPQVMDEVGTSLHYTQQARTPWISIDVDTTRGPVTLEITPASDSTEGADHR